jgi:apolipoprotein N-acyltransferase
VTHAVRSASYPVRCGVALLSGVVYALAFLPFGWNWLVVPGIAGFLWSLRGQRGSRARGIGFLHGMALFATGIPWLWLVFGVPAIGLWMILALFPAMFAWMQGRAEERGMARLEWVIFTMVNWCGWEFIRAEIFPLKFPWMTPGLALGPHFFMPWVGVYGTGLTIVLFAALLVKGRWFMALVLAVVVIRLKSGGEMKWAIPLVDDPSYFRVDGLQYESVSFDHYANATRRLTGEAQRHVRAGLQYVVWPEYAVPYDIRANKRDWGALQDLCREKNITLTFGTRTAPKGQTEWFNTALTLDATGVLGEHHKVHTVHFFDDGTPGKTSLPVDTANGKIGTPICFDGDYEGVVRRMTKAGAEAFVVPLMDAVSWSKLQHDQHAQLFRIRACENARWLFVCATSGVSQLIDSNGSVRTRLGAMEQGTMSGMVRRKTDLTFYTRWGWLTPWCLTGLAVGWWIVLLLPRRAAKDVAS